MNTPVTPFPDLKRIDPDSFDENEELCDLKKWLQSCFVFSFYALPQGRMLSLAHQNPEALKNTIRPWDKSAFLFMPYDETSQDSSKITSAIDPELMDWLLPVYLHQNLIAADTAALRAYKKLFVKAFNQLFDEIEQKDKLNEMPWLTPSVQLTNGRDLSIEWFITTTCSIQIGSQVQVRRELPTSQPVLYAYKSRFYVNGRPLCSEETLNHIDNQLKGNNLGTCWQPATMGGAVDWGHKTPKVAFEYALKQHQVPQEQALTVVVWLIRSLMIGYEQTLLEITQGTQEQRESLSKFLKSLLEFGRSTPEMTQITKPTELVNTAFMEHVVVLNEIRMSTQVIEKIEHLLAGEVNTVALFDKQKNPKVWMRRPMILLRSSSERLSALLDQKKYSITLSQASQAPSGNVNSYLNRRLVVYLAQLTAKVLMEMQTLQLLELPESSQLEQWVDQYWQEIPRTVTSTQF